MPIDLNRKYFVDQEGFWRDAQTGTAVNNQDDVALLDANVDVKIKSGKQKGTLEFEKKQEKILQEQKKALQELSDAALDIGGLINPDDPPEKQEKELKSIEKTQRKAKRKLFALNKKLASGGGQRTQRPSTGAQRPNFLNQPSTFQVGQGPVQTVEQILAEIEAGRNNALETGQAFGGELPETPTQNPQSTFAPQPDTAGHVPSIFNHALVGPFLNSLADKAELVDRNIGGILRGEQGPTDLFFDTLNSLTEGPLNRIGSFVRGLGTQAGEVGSNALNNLGAIQSGAQDLGQRVQSGVQDLGQGAANIAQGVQGSAGNLARDATQPFVNFGQGVSDLGARFADILQSAGNEAGEIVNLFERLLGGTPGAAALGFPERPGTVMFDLLSQRGEKKREASRKSSREKAQSKSALENIGGGRQPDLFARGPEDLLRRILEPRQKLKRQREAGKAGEEAFKRITPKMPTSLISVIGTFPPKAMQQVKEIIKDLNEDGMSDEDIIKKMRERFILGRK